MSHTPTPWRAGYESEAESSHTMIVRADEVDGQPWVAICRSNFGDIPIKANACFIARACNAFDPMKDALQAVVNRIDYLSELWGQEGVTRSLMDQVRSALALATKEDPS